MKILVSIFLIYINFCTSNFIHHGSKLPVTNYPKKVQPGMLQYLKGTIFKQNPTRDPGTEYTAWPTMAVPDPILSRRFFPPFEKTYVDEPNAKRRVKKVLQAYSVFGPKRAKRAVDPKKNDENVQPAPKQSLTSTDGVPTLTKSKPENPKSLKAQPSPKIASKGNGTRRRGALRSGPVKQKGKRGGLRQRKQVRRGKRGFPRRSRPNAQNSKRSIGRKQKNAPVKKTKRSKLRKRFMRNQSAKEGYRQIKSNTARKGHPKTGLKGKKQDIENVEPVSTKIVDLDSENQKFGNLRSANGYMIDNSSDNVDIVDTRRLIAAKDATIEEYPYVVSIQKGKEHWCAGAILNPRLVITTANCLWKGHRTTRLHVHAGSRFTDRGGQTANVQEIMKHPMWRLRSAPDYDLALMVLDRNLKFSHSLHAVDLPNRDMMPAFEDAWIASWGASRRDGVYDSNSGTLQVYHARVMQRNKCNNVTKRFGVAVSENFICLAQTGRRAPCTRDTGAPAVSDGVLWGLASWGIRKLCGTERYPAMFSYLASDANMDFIANATQYLMAEERFHPFLDAGPREIGHAMEPYA